MNGSAPYRAHTAFLLQANNCSEQEYFYMTITERHARERRVPFSLYRFYTVSCSTGGPQSCCLDEEDPGLLISLRPSVRWITGTLLCASVIHYVVLGTRSRTPCMLGKYSTRGTASRAPGRVPWWEIWNREHNEIRPGRIWDPTPVRIGMKPDTQQ